MNIFDIGRDLQSVKSQFLHIEHTIMAFSMMVIQSTRILLLFTILEGMDSLIVCLLRRFILFSYFCDYFLLFNFF